MGSLLRLLSFQMGVTHVGAGLAPARMRRFHLSAKLLSDSLCKVPVLRLLCKLCHTLLDAPQVGSRS